MTSSEGGPRRPRDGLRSLSSFSTTPSDVRSNGQRRSSQALERRVSNVIDVQDPARIIECSQLERQRKFQYLVRWYVLGGTCQRALITHAHERAATCHRYYTVVRAPIVTPQHASHATSAVPLSPIDRRRSSPHEHLPITSPVKATLTADCVLMSSRCPLALSKLKVLST